MSLGKLMGINEALSDMIIMSSVLYTVLSLYPFILVRHCSILVQLLMVVLYN